MYTRYWQLQKRPFENFASSEFYCKLAGHQAALEKLRYALMDRSEVCLITGQPGGGKTALLQQFARQFVRQDSRVVWLTPPFWGRTDLLWQIHQGLLPHAESDPVTLHTHPGLMLQNIQHELRSSARPVLLILDDAHCLKDASSLELLKALHETAIRDDARTPSPENGFLSENRLRKDLPTTAAKVSILLAGQPQTLLAAQEERGSYAVISLLLGLATLTRSEVQHYVRHRLEVSGRCENCFTDSAITELHRHSAGIIRRLNQLADLSLLAGFVTQQPEITEHEVRQAAQELLLPAVA